MTRKNIVFLSLGAAALMLVTAGASAYIVQKTNEPETKTEARASNQKITWNEPRREAQPQQQAVQQKPACNDSNIVGTALGAVGGGLVGSQIGKGKGQDLATIGGAIGGGYLGKEYIPTRGVLCPK